MTYTEILDQLTKSKNPLVKKMVEQSQEDLKKYSVLPKNKDSIDAILKRCIINISYKKKDGTNGIYLCSSNPYFIALMSIKKFSEYKDVVKLISKDLICHRSAHFATWDLTKNRRVEFVITRSQLNPFMGISISESNIELLKDVFHEFKPSIDKEKFRI